MSTLSKIKPWMTLTTSWSVEAPIRLGSGGGAHWYATVNKPEGICPPCNTFSSPSLLFPSASVNEVANLQLPQQWDHCNTLLVQNSTGNEKGFPGRCSEFSLNKPLWKLSETSQEQNWEASKGSSHTQYSLITNPTRRKRWKRKRLYKLILS